MAKIPVIERQCKHKGKKIVRREIFEDYFITAIDLCSKCVDDSDLTENIKYVDREVIPRKKVQTQAQIRKEISKRKDELGLLRQYKDTLWNIPDVTKKTPKLLSYYISVEVLQDELIRLYEKIFAH